MELSAKKNNNNNNTISINLGGVQFTMNSTGYIISKLFIQQIKYLTFL